MAHGRRWNEDNVDMNRNLLKTGQTYAGLAASRAAAEAAYAELASLLNPTCRWSEFSFWFRAMYYIVTKGYVVCKRALVSGQYTQPRGVWYGGAALAPAHRHVLDFLGKAVDRDAPIVAVDVHTWAVTKRHGAFEVRVPACRNFGDISRPEACAGLDRISTSRPRRRRDSSPRNIHVAAAVAPRLVSTECPRCGRGGAAIRLNGMPTLRPRRCRDSSPRNIHVAAAVAPRLSRGISTSRKPRRRRDSSQQNFHVAAATTEYSRDWLVPRRSTRAWDRRGSTL